MYPLSLEPPSRARPRPPGCHRALSWTPCRAQQPRTSCLFYAWWCVYVSALSIRPSLSLLHLFYSFMLVWIHPSLQSTTCCCFVVLWQWGPLRWEVSQHGGVCWGHDSSHMEKWLWWSTVHNTKWNLCVLVLHLSSFVLKNRLKLPKCYINLIYLNLFWGCLITSESQVILHVYDTWSLNSDNLNSAPENVIIT